MKYLFTLGSLFCFLQSFAVCPLPAPLMIKSANITSCQFLVKWKPVSGAVKYNLQYKESSSSNWTIISIAGNVTSYTITGLSAATIYKANVAAVCQNDEAGIYTNPISVKTLSCTIPTNINVSGIGSTSATVSWSTVCDVTKFTLQYRKIGASIWITVPHFTNPYLLLENLEASTTYEVRVKSKCPGGFSDYSPVQIFSTLTGVGGRNILLVIIDDARFDTYTATGGPSFFDDENISRIANEGVNFTKGFPALSLCAPSRGSIITGLYPHIHGVTYNPQTSKGDTIYQITIPQILHGNGYYTGLIGKYHISKNPQPGFDFWMETHNNNYNDTKYNVNGQYKTILGHQTDVVSDSAIGFFHKVPQGQPFFLWLGYKAPHSPFDPRPQEMGIYNSYDMPFPDNYEEYDINAPEFLYDCHSLGDSAFVVDFYHAYFELLKGVDVRLGDILDELESMDLLDSTLIIFMSDNGYLLGEHQLMEKELGYEESIHIPIFMRYPGLIPQGMEVNEQIAMNIDIAPTLLDFAGIPDTFGMQGISLLKLMNNEVTRKEMFYEFFNKSCVPDIRAIRSLEYKYVAYNCNQETEEFFDLINDPKENVNLVNDPDFAALIEDYRDKLTFWRNYYEDFSLDSLYTCQLANPQKLVKDDNNILTLLNAYPNPANSHVTIHFISSEKNVGSVRISNALGITEYAETFNAPLTEFSHVISIENLAPGNYFVAIQHGSHMYRQSFVKL